MLALRSRRSATLLGIGVAVLAVMLRLAHQALRDPEVPFLTRSPPAEWILFPRAPAAVAHGRALLATTFTRSFVLEEVPARAPLRVRMHRGGSLALNGQELLRAPFPDVDWKRERTLEAAPLLRPGPNTLVVTAEARAGPAALWLALELGPATLVSDATWSTSCAGSAERPARLARAPMSAWTEPSPTSPLGAIGARARNPSPLEGLRARAGTVAGCAVLALALVLGLRALATHGRLDFAGRGLGLFLLAVATLVTALFWNNRALSPFVGFDARHHVEYVDHVRAQGSIPLADQGAQMYQPPLYYALAAGALRLAGKAQLDEESAWVVRSLGAGALVLQALFVALSLRLLFADRPKLAFVGACFGALMPMQLYLYQYVTNESLAAVLVSAALYLALRIVSGRASGVGAHALLGLALGAALLAKVSSVLALVVIVAVLGARLLARGERSPRAWLGTVGASVAVAGLVSAWYYLRVHARFGQFLVLNVDEVSSYSWWQDPGVRTLGDYLRFGVALERPLFSAFHSCLDALYSTAWGDGMLGGLGRIDVRPPWDYELMAVGGGLACLPTLAIVLGVARASLRLVRAPQAAWFLLLGLALVTLAALLDLTLALPYYAQAKSVYAASLMIPLSACAALGFEALARLLGRAEPVLWTLFGTWALVSVAAFRAPAGLAFELATPTADDEAWFWTTPAARQPGAESLARLERSVARAADNPGAHVALCEALLARGELTRAVAAARSALALDPSSAHAHYLLGLVHHRQGEAEAMLTQLDYAAQLERGNAGYALDLAQALSAAGRPDDAAAVLARTRTEFVRRGQEVPPGLEERLAEPRAGQ